MCVKEGSVLNHMDCRSIKEKGALESCSLKEALDLTAESKDTKEIVLGALLNPSKHIESILSQWSSQGVKYTEGKVPPQFISQWNKEAEQEISQGKLYGHTSWGPTVIFRLVLVPADLSWGKVEQLSRELSDAKGFFQHPSGCGTIKGMLLYNPQHLCRPGEILWEVLGEVQ